MGDHKQKCGKFRSQFATNLFYTCRFIGKSFDRQINSQCAGTNVPTYVLIVQRRSSIDPTVPDIYLPTLILRFCIYALSTQPLSSEIGTFCWSNTPFLYLPYLSIKRNNDCCNISSNIIQEAREFRCRSQLTLRKYHMSDCSIRGRSGTL